MGRSLWSTSIRILVHYGSGFGQRIEHFHIFRIIIFFHIFRTSYGLVTMISSHKSITKSNLKIFIKIVLKKYSKMLKIVLIVSKILVVPRDLGNWRMVFSQMPEIWASLLQIPVFSRSLSKWLFILICISDTSNVKIYLFNMYINLLYRIYLMEKTNFYIYKRCLNIKKHPFNKWSAVKNSQLEKHSIYLMEKLIFIYIYKIFNYKKNTYLINVVL